MGFAKSSTHPTRALNSHYRHCERSEAIHASACGEMDCFAALAMTLRDLRLPCDDHHGRRATNMRACSCSNQQVDVMFNSLKPIAAASLFAALAFATPSIAATFDGDWNVQITSSNAACPSGASVSIEINNGQVASNSAAVTASGRVAEAGAIRVTLATGMKRATGSGVLNGTSGSGTWRAAMCSGTWTAQRI
jgi:hypothetical protein